MQTQPTIATVPTGILLVNTGTPDAPTKEAVKPYLARFLSDRRIVNIPPLLWKPVLHAFVLNARPRKTVEIYQRIWTPRGSPYTLWSQSIERKLQERLDADKTVDARVRMAHRYGNPSMAAALEAFMLQGITHVTVLPLYPQRAFATTSSVHDELDRVLAALDYHPTLTFIEDYHNDPAYLDAVARTLLPYVDGKQHSAHLILSYHSVPKKDLRNGDHYQSQVLATTLGLLALDGLNKMRKTVAYQSRFDDAQRWLGPFLHDELAELLDKGERDFIIISPVFAVDCTETLNDICHNARNHLFNHAQQRGIPAENITFTYVPALNDSDAHIEVLRGLIQKASRAALG